MRARPLVYCAPLAVISLFIAMKLQYHFNFHLLLFIFSFLLCLVAFSLSHPKLCKIFIGMAVISFTLTYFSAYQMIFVKPVQSLQNKTYEVSATLQTDATQYDNSTRAELIVTMDDSKSFRTLCYLPLTEEPLKAGTKIRLRAYFYIPQKTEGFDRASYQAGNGYHIAASYEKNDNNEPAYFEVIDSNTEKIRYFPQTFSRKVKNIISEIFSPAQAGLLNALLLGDKSELAANDYTALQKSGMSHLVAVSGLHISFLIGFCFLVFGRKWGSIVGIIFILLFIPMAGATPSVIRSGIMFFVTAFGFLLGKQTDSLNSLAIALFILLLKNPYAILSLSLQLSFASTLGIIILTGPLQERLIKLIQPKNQRIKKLLYILAASISCSISSLLFTAPILFSSFGYVSVLSLISNLCVLGVTAICFIGGIICCLVYFIVPSAAILIAKFIALFLNYLLWIAHTVSNLPIGVIYWGDKFGIISLLLFSVLVLLLIYCYQKIKWKFVLPVFIIAIVTTSFLGIYYNYNQNSVTFLPCGSGNAILVSSSQDELVLIDCAGKNKNRDISEDIIEWMQWNNYDKINAVILTSIDQSHARDLESLLNQVSVDEIIIPDKLKRIKTNSEIFDMLNNCSVKITTVAEESELSIFSIKSFLIADGKLGVLIDDEVLILHSPTTKQLNKYFEDNKKQAKTLVLSQKVLSDINEIQTIIEKINPTNIIIQASSEVINELNGITVQTPYLEGEIVQTFRKE